MTAFTDAYAQLNPAQKQAVDTIEGPVLVIAGPGTGKTQLLSARVANILAKTDTPAANILCLTFTESGAANMRERLSRFIGQAAYDITISTYHAFGSDLINRYPDYFAGLRLQNPIDELSKRQIVVGLLEAMSYKNPLKQLLHHPGDLVSTISEIKRGLLSSDDLKTLAGENSAFIEQASHLVANIFGAISRMPSSYAKALPYYDQTLQALLPLLPDKSINQRFGSLAVICCQQLQAALQEAEASNSSKPLTSWKNNWLAKNADNQFVIDGALANKRLLALADFLRSYQSALQAGGYYDFDDMILESIKALESNADLRFTLQERYLYVLLDEFQDTNAAQLQLIKLLTDNPVHEGRPNVLAVGDDDQAIYAFQGAQYSNMLEFFNMYQDTALINLTENYRSTQPILDTAAAIAGQISSRLSHQFSDLSKQLTGHNSAPTVITRRDFLSDVAERGWVAAEIKRLIDDGTNPADIAVLAPKHRYLEPLVPFLQELAVPVRYEKRENILDAVAVKQLLTMARLATALAGNDQAAAEALWPAVLSFDFWELPVASIWQLSWQAREASASWSQLLLASDDQRLRRAGLLLLCCANHLKTDSCEIMLDYLIGSGALTVNDEAASTITSPFRAFYTSDARQSNLPQEYYETLSHLSVLRSRLREYQAGSDQALQLQDLLHLVSMYQEAGQPMLDTSPYAQATDAVQLMTVFKAKGLEYEHVFLVGCQDDVWGGGSRGNSNKLTLPANLDPIRHTGSNDDERLRILFVAITRARHGLYLTAARQTYSGKAISRLKYFDEQDGTALVLPEPYQTISFDDSQLPAAATLEIDWLSHYQPGDADTLRNLLAGRLTNYQISPTDVIKYIDVQYGGPERFFYGIILRFPTAPGPDGLFGTAIHETLEWLQVHGNQHNGEVVPLGRVLEIFEQCLLAKKLPAGQYAIELERGRDALATYLQQRGHIYQQPAVTERNFRNEAAFCGPAHLAGRVDRLEVDDKAKTITVVDYKTGKSYAKWGSDTKLHKNELQLYLYKLVIENSRSYRGYTVTGGRLEFIEPDNDGRINTLELTFKPERLAAAEALLQAVWGRVQALDFPDTSKYAASVSGIKQFEADLVDK